MECTIELIIKGTQKQYIFVTDYIEIKLLKVNYCTNNYMFTYCFTKHKQGDKFYNCIKIITNLF